VLRIPGSGTDFGVTPEGRKDVLGIWIEQTEGAKFWLRVMTEIKNRGVNLRSSSPVLAVDFSAALALLLTLAGLIWLIDKAFYAAGRQIVVGKITEPAIVQYARSLDSRRNQNLLDQETFSAS
jgi:hypothetical protein